jgi:hypothetical protein
MAILAPFILSRVYQDLDPAKALKRNVIRNQARSARFVGNRLICLWVAVARVNHLLFQDFVQVPTSLLRLRFYIQQERELFLEVGQLVAGFENPTPNFHVGIHIPDQIYLCTPHSSCLI